MTETVRHEDDMENQLTRRKMSSIAVQTQARVNKQALKKITKKFSFLFFQ